MKRISRSAQWNHSGGHRPRRIRAVPQGKSRIAPTVAGAVFSVLAALLLSSCLWIYGPEMGVPENLSASVDETDKIILTWGPVENADIYYIYRSPRQHGDFDYHSFSYTADFTDTDIDPEVPYWYRVTSSDLESNNESPRTAAVMGDSLHDFAWSQTAVLSTAANRIRICADPAPEEGSREEYRAWAVLAGDTPGSPAEVHGYNRDTDTWEVFGDPFGSIDPSVPGSVDVAAYAGGVYAAYADTGYGGRITVKRYNWAGETWENVGTTGPEGISGSDGARYISLETARDADNPLPEVVWIGFDGSEYTVWSSFYDDITDSWSGPEDLPAGTAATDPYAGTSSLRTDSRLIAAFEDESGSGDRIRPAEYGGGGWNQLASSGGLPGGGDNIIDGYFELAGFAADALFIAYMTDTLTFEVRGYNGSDWNSVVTPAGITVSSAAERVGLAADDVDGEEFLYLFYRDSLSGYVRKRNIAAGTWELLPVSTDTEEMSLNPTFPETAAHNNIVYCAYLSGSSAQVRVWR